MQLSSVRRQQLVEDRVTHELDVAELQHVTRPLLGREHLQLFVQALRQTLDDIYKQCSTTVIRFVRIQFLQVGE